ncbi:DUF2303 family protein [Massilia yuzhufengensis]|uniref:Uncharacterized conserved protein YfdQ, DUF2303 family n=1 Tax=Massilia yuzhufengensis TaxID=1164594 RepID=A0A1I1VMZ0_9BURK|nr:DUF2303 family protein [Massilia yuzhufengensis]SFD84174.1 Uncharacterized conserved protein YfdQ, DUF2303 family [Massilia yuzhufengensis]
MNDNKNETIGLVAGTASTQEHFHIDATAIEQIGALSLAASSVQEIGGTTHLVIPNEHKHIDLTTAIERAGTAPRRKSGTVQLGDIHSFNVFVADQGVTSDVYIYADPEARTLTAVLNDHVKSGSTAGWRDLRAVFKAELSREFATWMSFNKKPMEQEEFAIFLEDNIADVVEPSGETLLQVALTLQAKTEVNFASHRRLDNGQVQFTYNETIDARAGTGLIEIPREFTIGARLFKNGDGYKVRARLKYRLLSGKVKFWYELDRAENAIEDAFQAYINQARENGFSVLIGKP